MWALCALRLLSGSAKAVLQVYFYFCCIKRIHIYRQTDTQTNKQNNKETYTRLYYNYISTSTALKPQEHTDKLTHRQTVSQKTNKTTKRHTYICMTCIFLLLLHQYTSDKQTQRNTHSCITRIFLHQECHGRTHAILHAFMLCFWFYANL